MKHIKVKYFYFKDKIDQNEIIVEHCPTEQMWTDINTKPMQGAIFQEFWCQVMGIPGNYVDSLFEHSIYLRPPDSPEGYQPQQPTPQPSMSVDRSMLPVPRDSVAPQECVEENQIGKPADEENQIGEPADGIDEVAAHSEG